MELWFTSSGARLGRMGWVRDVARRPAADLLLAVEALALMAVFRAALVVVPVRRIMAAVAGDTPETASSETRSKDTARRVAWAVSAAARHSPVEFVCFPQALAGYTMLRRRGVARTLVYGVGRSDAGELHAHTWLVAGERILLGGEAARDFTAIERWS